MPTYTPLTGDDRDAEEEIRFAAVLNGGVSLAIWMGGVCHELDRLTRRDGVYGDILRALRSRARVDVIGGTSAGGINGAFLAVAQSHPDTPLARLRDVWAAEGSMATLLHKPWVSEPASLLQGDAVFWPALRRAFADLLPQPGMTLRPYDPADRPIELVITTTLLHPTSRAVADSLGAPVQQPRRRGRFVFRRGPTVGDHFAPDDSAGVALLADQLALASRATASFPVAFEPFFVPAAAPTAGTRPDSGTEQRPTMAGIADFDRDRWVIDGGVLMNTPLQPVLDAIVAAPATVQTRRVLLLVVPDPYVAPQAAAQSDQPGRRPEIPEVLGGIVSAWQGATFEFELNRLEEHNRDAVMRRQARTDLLESLEPDQLAQQAAALWPGYRAIRLRRAALAVAEPLCRQAGQAVERVTADVTAAMAAVPVVPFVPDGLESRPDGRPAGDWRWGIATLERLAVSVLDLLRTTMWLLPPGSPAKAELSRLREEYYAIVDVVRGYRRSDNAFWQDWAAGRSGADPVTTEELTTALTAWSAQVLPATSAGTVADDLLRIANEAAGHIPDDTEESLDVLAGHRALLLRQLFRHDDPARRRWAAAALEVCYVCLVDQTQGQLVSDQAIELVSVSAGTALHLDGVDQPAPQARVAGLHLGHFAAFLKQAWRINDWIWGRIEGADRLVTTLLDPQRLRRLVLLDGGGEPAVERLLTALLPGADLAEPRWAPLRQALLGHHTDLEVRRALQPVITTLVTRIANAVVAEEQPALRAAAEADRAAHDDTRSRAGRWLDHHPAGRPRPSPTPTETSWPTRPRVT
jgi:patatin-related protein